MAGGLLRDLLTLPADAALAWRQQGPRGLAAEVKARSLSRVLRYVRLLIIEQDLAAGADAPLPADVKIATFAGPDWSPLGEIATRRTLARFREASRRGRVCLVAWRAGHPVGYTWISDRIDLDVETYPIPLPPGAAYLWDLYVLPPERNRGIGSALVLARLREARARGFRVGVRAIEPSNRASLRTLEKTAGGGVRIVGELTYVKLLKGTFGRLRTLRPDAAGGTSRRR